MLTVTRAFFALLIAVGLSVTFAPKLSAQGLVEACYVQRTGVIYLIDPSETLPGDLPTGCRDSADKHIQFSWASLAADDGNVGIGVSEPTVALDVAGDIHATGVLKLGNNTMTFDGVANTITSGVDEDIAILPGGTGKVGIGTNSPSQLLTVAGVIESTSGGLKFPDGTTQTTAASGGGGPYVPVDGVAAATDGFAVTGTVGDGNIPAVGPGTRLMWYPGKAAFRVGLTDGDQWNPDHIGIGSVAMGSNTMASGRASFAMGEGTTANGDFSVAMGQQATAGRGFGAVALGGGTWAVGIGSTAMGSAAMATGDFSVAMGDRATADQSSSVAIGRLASATGQYSLAISVGEQGATASGYSAVALGDRAKATEQGAVAMGQQATASGSGSVALGTATASGLGSVALGLFATAGPGGGAVAMGQQATASGSGSVALGTLLTANGDKSTAMGSSASTFGMRGAFVYGDDSGGGVVNAPAANSFTVRAAGGTTFYSNSTLSAGVRLGAGGGAWSTVSDRSRKRDFEDVDGESVLASIAGMPIQEWSYLSQDPSIRHLGPVAQDFYAAFGLGDSDLTITTSDISGVNMLAVQALEERTRDLQDENDELRSDNDQLRERLDRLEAMLQALSQ